MQVVKKFDLSFLMRFAIFSREQQHTQRSAGGGASGQGEDLVSYVEFQRNYQLALRSHREALNRMQAVWELLMHTSIKFQALAEAVTQMDTAIKAADQVYK
jgi:hypothetical protein